MPKGPRHGDVSCRAAFALLTGSSVSLRFNSKTTEKRTSLWLFIISSTNLRYGANCCLKREKQLV